MAKLKWTLDAIQALVAKRFADFVEFEGGVTDISEFLEELADSIRRGGS